MGKILDTLFGSFRGKKVSPTKTVGGPGTAVYGGYVVEDEKNRALTDTERYRTFSNILANTSIVSAGVRYFLNLTAKAAWTFEPSEADIDGKFAEMAEKILTEDPDTSWARIVRRAAMFRFYGFSIQEWTARRREDGVMTFKDISPRAQITIERWDVDTDGSVRGVTQTNPQDFSEAYLPREKIVYLVDDTLNDSPQGLGLFRHLVDPANDLERFEQLEGFGFETDLRGIPVGRVPYGELKAAVDAGNMTEEEAVKAAKAIETFIERHVKRPDLGLVMDSAVYASLDDAASPSTAPKFDVSLLEGSQTSLPEIAKSIERKNREMARILGVESLLLGDGDRGSLALSKDKTNQFSLVIDATLTELADTFDKDLLCRIWQLNGWPEEMKPKMKPEAAQYRDIEQIAGALRDMALAGAVIDSTDPVINDVRALLGVAAQDVNEIDSEILETPVKPAAPGSVEDPEEDMPEDE